MYKRTFFLFILHHQFQALLQNLLGEWLNHAEHGSDKPIQDEFK